MSIRARWRCADTAHRLRVYTTALGDPELVIVRCDCGKRRQTAYLEPLMVPEYGPWIKDTPHSSHAEPTGRMVPSGRWRTPTPRASAETEESSE